MAILSKSPAVGSILLIKCFAMKELKSNNAMTNRLKKEGCTGFLPTAADTEKGGVHRVSSDDRRQADAEKGGVYGVADVPTQRPLAPTRDVKQQLQPQPRQK